MKKIRKLVLIGSITVGTAAAASAIAIPVSMNQQQSSQSFVDDTNNAGNNAGDNVNDNVNTGGNTGDNVDVSGGNTGDNTGGNTGDNTGDNVDVSGDNTGDNTGDNIGDNVDVSGGNTGGNTGDNTGGNTGDNTGDNVDVSGGNTGDNTGDQEEVTVAKDAVAPTSDVLQNYYFNVKSFEVTGNATFNNVLNEIFTLVSPYTVTIGANHLAGNYQNVDIAYVNNSANYDNSTFKISVTPKENHAWADGTTSAKTITVTCANLAKSYAQPIVSGGVGIHNYIKSDPAIYIANNTNTQITYEVKGLSVDIWSCPYGYTYYWQYSSDNGGTWTDAGNLHPTITINKGAVKSLIMRFVVDFKSFKFMTNSFEVVNGINQ